MDYAPNEDWRAGGDDLVAETKRLSVAGTAAVLVHVSTTIPSLSSLKLDSEGEGGLMLAAWRTALEGVPMITAGRRLGWRGLLLLAELDDDGATTAGNRLFQSLTRDPATQHVVWRVVLCAVGRDSDGALRNVDADAHASLRQEQRSTLSIVDSEGPSLRLLRSQAPG